LSLFGGIAWLIINLLQTIESVDPVVTSPASINKSNRKKKLSSTSTSKFPSDVKACSKTDIKPSTAEEIQSMKLEDLISEKECSLIPGSFLLTQLFYFGIFHSLANLPLNDKLLYGIHQRYTYITV
jgi:hypothetical protein